MSEVDIVIAGGGPAGLATAISCTQAGLSVVVAEPRTGPVDKACGEQLTPAAVQRLANIGVHATGHPLRGIRYLDERRSADAFYRGGIGYGVRRTELHTALADRAAELEIPVLPTKITGFTRTATGVSAAGVTARYLVAADGLHSLVRRACALDPPVARHRRYGLRRHYLLQPWTDLVEVHWSATAEAYATPLSDDLVGVAVLTGEQGSFEAQLAAFPALRKRLSGAVAASDVRGAGPLRQDVRCRAADRVLLVGDASGYLDALTGEGIGQAVAQAAVLAHCVAAGRVGDYERAWRQVSRRARLLTSGLLWWRHQPLLAPFIVPVALHMPRVYATVVNQVAHA